MRAISILAASWGCLGVLAILVNPIFRLWKNTRAAFDYSWSAVDWVILVAVLLFMLYSEGYRGFQQKFSPRVAARLLVLYRNPTWLRGLLAPFFAMGFFHTTRRQLITSYALLIFVIGVILLVRQLDQPLRGILDVGVSAGLAYGVGTVIFFVWQVARNPARSVSPDLPDS